MAERALREELDKSQEEQTRRHQVTNICHISIGITLCELANRVRFVLSGGDEGLPGASGHRAADLGGELQEGKGLLVVFLPPPLSSSPHSHSVTSSV